MNKRAVSPLFATLLLMAFAITLGFQIMKFLDDPPIFATECFDNVRFGVLEVGSIPRICMEQNTSELRFILQNEGLLEIGKLSVTIIGDTVDTIYLKETTIPSGGITAGDVTFSQIMKKIDQVEFRAQFKEAKYNTCPQSAVTVSSIPECPW